MSRRISWALVLMVCAAASAEDYPTAKSPWKDAASRRESYKKEIESLMSLPAEQVKPHPAAADFPGAVPPNAKPVTRTVVIDTSVTGWHSTGLYAAPGAKITVTTPPGWTDGKHQVRIGCHTDSLFNDSTKSWSRVPIITRKFPFTVNRTVVANAFGGPIYIDCPTGVRAEKVEIKIDGGVPAPHFVLGKTTPQQWKESRLAPAPWAELESPTCIVSVPSELVRKLDDPTAVMQLWDKIVKAEDKLAAVDDRTKPERVVFDRQISVGYMHSGYPFMCPVSAAPEGVEFAKLSKGNWGFFHELGHNHQKPEWTPTGTVEVTCNIFSMYVMDTVCKQPRTNHPAMSEAKRRENMQKFFSSSRDHEEWKKEPFLALIIYYQLAEGFGWEPFTKVFAEYRKLPTNQKPKTDGEKHDQFMVRFSRAVGRNLGPLYQAWNLPVSKEAVASIANLPAWLPEKDFPKAYVKK